MMRDHVRIAVIAALLLVTGMAQQAFLGPQAVAQREAQGFAGAGAPVEAAALTAEETGDPARLGPAPYAGG
ncbi:MAG: hypothetical protein K2X74_21530 [Acetobacteraceae bacterium]|nr:hypothetical protein [Acetobacteraceae bacterium]